MCGAVGDAVGRGVAVAGVGLDDHLVGAGVEDRAFDRYFSRREAVPPRERRRATVRRPVGAGIPGAQGDGVASFVVVVAEQDVGVADGRCERVDEGRTGGRPLTARRSAANTADRAYCRRPS